MFNVFCSLVKKDSMVFINKLVYFFILRAAHLQNDINGARRALNAYRMVGSPTKRTRGKSIRRLVNSRTISATLMF